MKKNALLIIAVALLSCNVANAQLLNRLGNAAKNAAENAAERRIANEAEKAVDKTVDKAIDSAKNSTSKSSDDSESEDTSSKKSKKQKDTEESTGWTCSACGHEGNNGKFCADCGAKQASDTWTCSACGHEGNKGKFCAECGAKQSAGDDGAQGEKAAPEKTIEMTYAKCDFVAGDEIIYEDNLVGEQIGEFPSKWDLLNGVVEIAAINGENVINFVEEDSKIMPLMENPKNYLPDVFTLEFDFWAPVYKTGDDYNSMRYDLRFESEDNDSWKIHIDRYSGNPVEIYWEYSPTSGDDDINGNTENVATTAAAWNHFALSFNKRALKMYINGVRVANIPNATTVNWFGIQNYEWGGFVGKGNMNIRNIRIAKGAVPLYDRMMTDGKFITYGITFDIGKSTIKPESMGEVNRIVKLMTDNPDLKFSVEGHTDNTGSAATNQTLSEARSKAIVDKLVELGIAKDRLTSAGKGQTSPIADNGTDEGRAKNRRVEFVKQ